MADVTNTHFSQRRNQAMRMTAPPNSKRISAIPNGGDARHQSAPQHSRLQQMQAKYQLKLTRERDAKQVVLHHPREQARLVLPRVDRTGTVTVSSSQKKGVVREFFKERRKLEKTGRLDSVPAPGSHLQKMRSEQESLCQQEEIKQDELQKFARPQNGRQVKPQRKSQGFCKSKPLAPIKQLSVERTGLKPPVAVGHFETTEELSSWEDDESSKVYLEEEKRAPNAINEKPKSYSSIVSKRQPKSKSSNKSNRIGVNGTAPRISSKVAANGKQRSTRPYQTKREEGESFGLTDFQKWQMEQDQQREARLSKYQEKLKEEGTVEYSPFPHDDSEEEENYDARVDRRNGHNTRMQEFHDNKEKELEALIAKHQADLQKLQVDDGDTGSDEENTNGIATFEPAGDNQTPTMIQNTEGRSENEEPPKGRADDRGKYKDRYCYQTEIQSPFDASGPFYPDEDADVLSIRGTTSSVTSKEDDSLRRSGQSYAGRPDLSEGEGEYDKTSCVDLRPCQICGHSFSADRLPKHRAICKKISNKERKVFDSTKHRTEGTDMAQFVRQGRHLQEPTQKRRSDWRKKHKEFIRAIRDAQTVQAHVSRGGKLSDLPPPKPAENPDYKQCPYCKRRFNTAAAERHIPHCKNSMHRPKPPPSRRP